MHWWIWWWCGDDGQWWSIYNDIMIVSVQRKYQNFAQTDIFSQAHHEKWALHQESLLGTIWVTKHQHFLKLCLPGKISTFLCKEIRRQHHRHPIFLARDKLKNAISITASSLASSSFRTERCELLRKPKNAPTLTVIIRPNPPLQAGRRPAMA